MDGKSLLPLLRGDEGAAKQWRSEVFLEYYYNDPNVKCVQNCTMARIGHYPHGDEMCVDLEARS